METNSKDYLKKLIKENTPKRFALKPKTLMINVKTRINRQIIKRTDYYR